jgi:hypothetical protein
MKNVVITWLAYLTSQNVHERHGNVVQSYNSLILLKDNAEIVVVDNSTFDILDVNSICNSGYHYFRANNAWFDVAAHYVALEFALKTGARYFIYAYDDFVFYDEDFIEDTTQFMDVNQDVCCIRLPKYEANNIDLYDRDVTGKCINPEAVAHRRAGVRNQCVVHYDMQTFGEHTFYKSNWRPQSRPTLWRTKDFVRIVGYPNKCPVMQGFEKHMHDCADKDLTYVSGFIDKGVCHTFSQDTSARIKAGNNFQSVNLQTLKRVFE